MQNFLKDSLTILKAVKASKSSHFPWYLPLMIFLAVGTAFGGLLLLTACMKRFEATYSAAMFVGSFVVSASIMSVIHYNTFEHLAGFNLILYPTGIAILIMGVFILIRDTKPSAAEEEEDDQDSSLRDLSEQSTSQHEEAVALVSTALMNDRSLNRHVLSVHILSRNRWYRPNQKESWHDDAIEIWAFCEYLAVALN